MLTMPACVSEASKAENLGSGGRRLGHPKLELAASASADVIGDFGCFNFEVLPTPLATTKY